MDLQFPPMPSSANVTGLQNSELHGHLYQENTAVRFDFSSHNYYSGSIQRTDPIRSIQMPAQQEFAAPPNDNFPIFWNVPEENESYFTGRNAELTEIKRILDSSPGRYAIIVGGSGFGKTQLIKAYLYSQKDNYQYCLWFDAGADLNLQFSELAERLLGINNNGGTKPELKKKVFQQIQKSWQSCLLVFDNAKNYQQIKPFLPQMGNRSSSTKKIHALLTTKNSKLENNNIIRLGSFSQQDAMAYLKKFKFMHEHSEETKLEFVEMLSKIPLAITQGACFLDTSKTITLPEYIKLFKEKKENRNKIWKRQEKIFDDEDYDKPQLDDYTITIKITVQMSLESIAKKNLESLELLRFCGFLYETKIPQFVLEELSKTKKHDETQLILLDEQLENLFEYSLIGYEKINGKLYCNMHSLIQLIIRDLIPYESYDEILKTILSVLNTIFIYSPASYKTNDFIDLLNHVSVVIEHVSKLNKADSVIDETVARLYYKLGLYWGQRKNECGKALEYFNKARLNFPKQELPSLLRQMAKIILRQNKQDKFIQADKLYNEIMGLEMPTLDKITFYIELGSYHSKHKPNYQYKYLSLTSKEKTKKFPSKAKKITANNKALIYYNKAENLILQYIPEEKKAISNSKQFIQICKESSGRVKNEKYYRKLAELYYAKGNHFFRCSKAFRLHISWHLKRKSDYLQESLYFLQYSLDINEIFAEDHLQIIASSKIILVEIMLDLEMISQAQNGKEIFNGPDYDKAKNLLKEATLHHEKLFPYQEERGFNYYETILKIKRLLAKYAELKLDSKTAQGCKDAIEEIEPKYRLMPKPKNQRQFYYLPITYSASRSNIRERSLTVQASHTPSLSNAMLNTSPQIHQSKPLIFFKNPTSDECLFDTWYSPETLKYLLHSTTNPNRYLRYVFYDKHAHQAKEAFQSQLEALVQLSNNLYKPALFISKEPGNESHWLLGLYYNTQLIIMNPAGLTKHQDAYEILNHALKQKTVQSIYLTTNQLQHDPKGYVSCGPISMAMALHWLNQPIEQLFNFLTQTVQPLPETIAPRTLDKNQFKTINLNDTLPTTLQHLDNAPDNLYRESLIQLRQSHYEHLAMETQLQGETKQEAYWETCLNAPEQDIIFRLSSKELNLNNLMTDKIYQALKQSLNLYPSSSFLGNPSNFFQPFEPAKPTIKSYKDQRFQFEKIKGDGDCGFSALGLTRQQAYDLLNHNIQTMQNYLSKLLEEELLSGEDFIKYAKEKGIAPKGLETAFQSYQQAFESRQNIETAQVNLLKYVKDLSLINIYLTYDMQDKKTGGWAHPLELHALAKIQNRKLYIWQSSEIEAYVAPHEHHHDDKNNTCNQALHILYNGRDHFDKLVPIAIEETIKQNDVPKLNKN